MLPYIQQTLSGDPQRLDAALARMTALLVDLGTKVDAVTGEADTDPQDKSDLASAKADMALLRALVKGQ